ncbi:MAG TPA: MFS transporter [Jatrophihabitans sp.]|uniref:MFS transporter n=1 Tax=Jatrophihabitans sp. TaxID=1932789 RepID=UPI002EEF528B
MSGWQAWLRSVALDLGPLRRYRDFRLRTIAASVSTFGAYFTMIAVPIQIKELTDSTVAVGLVGVFEFVPIVAVGLLGGAVADRFDRRRVVLISELAALACTLVLLANSLLPEPRLWVIYLVAAGAVSASSMQRPSLDAMLPRYVPHAEIPSASMVNNQAWGLANIAGTMLGGVLASVNVSVAYTVDVASFVVSLLVFLRLSPLPRVFGAVVPGVRATLGSVGEGIRYAAGRKDLLGTYLVDTIAMTTAMPVALFPFFAAELGVPHAIGLLYAADSVGGLLAGAFSGWVRRVHRHGLAIIVAALCWGASMGLAGLMPNLGLALVFLACAGAADMVSGTFRGVIWDQTIPDELRGRLAGIELLSYSIGPTLGNARAGFMAVGGVRFAIASGGLLCVLGVSAAAAALPRFRAYDSRTDEFVRAEKERRSASSSTGATPSSGPST